MMARVAWALLSVWVAAIVVTGLVHAAPGDALAAIPDGEALRPVLAARWHLDQPWPQRVMGGATRLLRGDLGTSLVIRPGAPVSALCGDAVTRTLTRTLLAWLLLGGAGAALALGASPAWVRRVGLVTMLPTFAATHVVVMALNAGTWAGLQAGWWARPTWFALPAEDTWHREALAVALLATTSGLLSDLTRELRAVAEPLRDGDAAELILARGASITPFVLRHMVVPMVDRLQARLPALLAGAVVIEHVLLLPGAGTLFWDAAELRDVDVAGALAVGAAATVTLARLAADLVRLAWDPREST